MTGSGRGDRETAAETHCPRCGQYMPMRLNGSERVHDCDRTPPLDGLPPTICACPVCGGHGLFRWGCWGTEERPHPHAYMRPVHELVRERFVSVRPDNEEAK